jgi:hypothetical protein
MIEPYALADLGLQAGGDNRAGRIGQRRQRRAQPHPSQRI